MREKNRLKLLGFLLAWVIALAACAAFAQPELSRGGALKRRAYQTYGTITLYVDPTGSDANACTASGTSACATLAGALGKLPYRIRHNVTVNVAAGNYAEGVLVSDFNIARGVTLAITGTLSAFSPATGSASGTVTATSTWATTGAPTMTDGAQTWTASNLRFAFIQFTSGALNGQAFPIQDNTATVLTLPTSTSPAGGVTYSLVVPGSVFTSTGTFGFGNITGAGTLALSNLKMVKASGTLFSNVSTDLSSTTVTFTSCDLRATAGTALSLSSNGAYTFTRSLFTSAASTQQSAVVLAGLPRVTASSCLVSGTGNGGALGSGVFSGQNTWLSTIFDGANLGLGSYVVSTSTASPGMFLALSNSALICRTAGKTGIGPSSDASVAGLVSLLQTVSVSGCATAAHVDGWVLRVFSGATAVGINNATTGFEVLNGGRLHLTSLAPAFNTVTNELSVDGTNYTYAFLNTLSPSVIIGPYDSAIHK